MNLRYRAARSPLRSNDDVVPQLPLPRTQQHLHKVRKFLFIAAFLIALLPIRIDLSLNGSFAATPNQSSDTSGVELCYYADGPGQEVSGQINGRPFTNHARIFRVTVDDTEQDAFCTDLYNPIGTKQCHSNSGIGVTDPKVACVLQHYPPGQISEDAEAAAVQSAIWHFSDGFELSPAEPIYSRYQSIIDTIEDQYISGTCLPVENWQLSVEVEDAVHFLQPVGDGFRPDQHLIFIKLFGEDKPVPNQLVQVSTDVGSLSWASQRGQSLSVVTDEDGAAVVAIAHDTPATATIDVTATVQMPTGTRVDPGPTVQKLVLSGSDSYRLRQQQQVEWVAGEKLVVKKFHDMNRDGSFNHNDELIDWTVEICEAGTNTCFQSPLGDGGSRIFALNPDKQYDVCEIVQENWLPTTPLCHENLSLPESIWFGNVELPSLVIEKYHDLNGNGIKDEGEPGIEGWPFQVMRQNGADLIATYSGNTDVGGRLGYSNIGFHTYQIDELLPSTGLWHPSTPASQQVEVHDKRAYTVTFGNLQMAALTVDKTWLIDSVEVTPPAGTTTTACVRRTGPGEIGTVPAPVVDGVALPQGADGFYCYSGLIDSVTFENLWPGTYEIIERPPGNWTPIVIPGAVSIESGQHFSTAGFVNSTTTAAIGDFVWFDGNQNGLQDSGERGVSNIVVRLLDATGAELAQTHTDALGQYFFGDLLPGDYSLLFELPADYQVSPQNQQVNNQASSSADSDLVDSDVDAATGRTVLTTLLPGEFDMSWDAGIFKPTSPSFQFEKYINGNQADSLQDAVLSEPNQILTFNYEVINTGDVPLLWDVLHDDVFGELTLECRLPIEIAVGRTESCRITRLAEAFPNGKMNIGTVTLSEGPSADPSPTEGQPLPTQSDVAWYKTPLVSEPARLGDRVWIDENQNGVQDANEPGVPSIQVTLLDENGNSLGIITGTDSEGFYTFEQLAPGTYGLEFSIPYGYTLTQPFQGANSALDSDGEMVLPYQAHTPSVTLEAGESNLTLDIGLIESPPLLAVNKVPLVKSISPGELLTYTIHYSNSGGADAINVNIVEKVPQNTTFVDSRSSSGWACDDSNSGSVCIYSLGMVPAQTITSEPILFVVRVNKPLPITVTQIANTISIEDTGAPNAPSGFGNPAVVVPVQHVVLGTPPVAEPIPERPDKRYLTVKTFIPLR